MPMVVDTHTHIGAPSTPQPLLFRTEQLETYKTLAVPEGVTGTVVVESSGNVEDNQWMLDRAAEDPFIVGIVGHLDPFAETFTTTLSATLPIRSSRVSDSTWTAATTMSIIPDTPWTVYPLD